MKTKILPASRLNILKGSICINRYIHRFLKRGQSSTVAESGNKKKSKWKMSTEKKSKLFRGIWQSEFVFRTDFLYAFCHFGFWHLVILPRDSLTFFTLPQTTLTFFTLPRSSLTFFTLSRSSLTFFTLSRSSLTRWPRAAINKTTDLN